MFGINGHLSDVHAAIAVGQLERFDELQAARALRVQQYDQELRRAVDAGRIRILPHDPPHGLHLYVIEVLDGPVTRNALLLRLAEKGIGSSVHYPPVTEHATYWQPTPPVADRLARGILSLPLFPTMSEDECTYVCTEVTQCLM